MLLAFITVCCISVACAFVFGVLRFDNACFVCIVIALASGTSAGAASAVESSNDDRARCSERCGDLRHVGCGTLEMGRHNDEQREYSICESAEGLVLKLAPKP